jgi:hypothetical protein
MQGRILSLKGSLTHRVDRVLGLFSSRPNWDPPRLPESVFPPLVPGATRSLARERVRGLNLDEGTHTMVLLVFMYIVA